MQRHTDAPAEIEPAEAYDLLSNDRRRRALSRLRTAGRCSLAELTDAVARTETGERPPPEGLRHSVYNSLRQTHLPRLAAAGVVAYDRDSQVVRLRRRARALDRYRHAAPGGLTWAAWYRNVAVAGLWGSLLVHLGVPPLAGLDGLAVTVVSLAALAGVGIARVWHRRWLYRRLLVGR